MCQRPAELQRRSFAGPPFWDVKSRWGRHRGCTEHPALAEALGDPRRALRHVGKDHRSG